MPIDADSIFLYGGRWLRADFHLHTRADKEFSYSGDDNSFVSDYTDALKKAGITVGIITNHNKFDSGEFKALRKTAKKKQIFLLPGVELSVNDGANGIHTIIVFSEQWLKNSHDHISQFLNVIFEGKTPEQYENKNGRSSFGLIETIKKLEGYHMDFFLIFPHVENSSGLWRALKGGRLQEMGENEFFIRRTLAFQGVRTYNKPDCNCRVKVQKWLGDAYPAEVEGSDCKTIAQIGQNKGKLCHLKIGDFSFGAVKYALMDHTNRIAFEPGKHKHSHILSVSFDGGVLNGKTIRLSPELNTLIGIRGSGKSSILEIIRYVFDIPFGEKALDTDYKMRLIDHVLGSGGKVTAQAVDRRGQHYEIRRINKKKPDVYIDGVVQPGISIRETILHKPIYFGQKDLSATGDGFEKDLVEKLVGEKLAGIRSRIDAQRQKVSELVNRLTRLSNTEDGKKEYEDKKQDAEFRLTFYRKHGIEKKLQKQVDFDADSRKCSKVVSFACSYLAALEEFVNQHDDDLKNQRVYTSRQNKDFFEDFFTLYDKLITFFGQIRKMLSDGSHVLTELKEKAGEFEKIRESLKEEFAEIERGLSDQLRQSGAQAIRPDEFRQLRKTVDQANQMLKTLDNQEYGRKSLEQELSSEIARLNEFWHEEYREIQRELDKVNDNHSSLEIKAEFKADKAAFAAFIKDVFRGSRIREATFSSMVKAFSDFGDMYENFDKVRMKVGVSSQVFEKYFTENLSALLIWQVPNRFSIEYHGRELKYHSLGQRASALILFVLGQQENDVFIIDQPEDDLDSQTVYEDVIKLVRSLKPKTQFIFTTHNANFPVLGDAEQIVSCFYADDLVYTTSGSIDRQELQQDIVDIMEGGEEAFRQRRRRYEIWKPQSL